jgi:SRSO17 transposase
MGRGVESRFERYAEKMIQALGHVDRATPARWYLRGLMLPGQRKSVEPMAARVHAEDVGSAHQSMHHLVADSDWSDTKLLAAVAAEVVAVLSREGQAPCFWIIDDTSYRKWGKHSVGVARQYCGHLGKTENGQVAVSLTLATEEASVPLNYRLYLPQEWTRNKKRCRAAGVPQGVGFATKGELAWAQIEAALAAGMPRGTVLMDAGYGDEAAMRDRLSAHQLSYAVGVRSGTKVWWAGHQPAAVVHQQPRGRPRTRLRRTARHQPISVLDLARALPAASWHIVQWREGTNTALTSRFARVRCRAAQGDRARAEEWLLIEWPRGEAEPIHYFLSNLRDTISLEDLVATVKMRWRIERDYLELKQELGLGHYEGRNWRGFHHHASLCIAAYGFLMLERLSGIKKNAARLQAPALPESFRPRGAGPDAAPRSVVDRDPATSSGMRHRTTTSSMPMLREIVPAATGA